MERKTQRYKMIIDKAASGLLMELGFEKLTKNIISERTSLKKEIISNIYPNDDQLRLAGMRYLAEAWCKKIRIVSERINDNDERLRYIVSEFVFGTDLYHKALSAYVEALYNIIKRTDNNTYLGDELLGIYKMYVNLFITCLWESPMYCSNEMRSCAWIFVVISDGIHIQSLLKNNLIEKNAAINILVSLIKSEFITKKSIDIGDVW